MTIVRVYSNTIEDIQQEGRVSGYGRLQAPISVKPQLGGEERQAQSLTANIADLPQRASLQTCPALQVLLLDGEAMGVAGVDESGEPWNTGSPLAITLRRYANPYDNLVLLYATTFRTHEG